MTDTTRTHPWRKQKTKKREYHYWWNVIKRPAPQKCFWHLWAFHFLRCSVAVLKGKNISGFLPSFKPCKLLERGCWFQRSTQNSLAFTALYGAPGKMTPFFQGWKLRSQRDSHCDNCLLDHLLSHFISQEKRHRSVLNRTSIPLHTSSTERYKNRKPNVCDCLQKRIHATDVRADHDRSSMASFLHRLSGEALWCSAHTELLSPATHLLKPKWLHSSFCSAPVVRKKPLPMTYESGDFSSLIWVWTETKCFLRCAALFPLLFWGLNRFN